MHPQLMVAVAQSNQDEFLRRAARLSGIHRPPRPNRIHLPNRINLFRRVPGISSSSLHGTI
jgi:hypothetical protein